ncbi:MAG: hypothetical protein IBX72_13850 [Nitrospirae bacterium]|nr:hypothetical protein [Nitrospirota bacterium]
MHWEYLVSLDIGTIHDYIFGTNKLREIRGASILLDKLNRELPLDEIENSKYGKKNTDWRCIVAGGGNIKILFNDKSKAKEYKRYLASIFRENAPDAKFTVIISERKGDSEGQWLKRTERELQIAKSMHEERKQITASGLLKACQVCGINPAEDEDPRPEGTIYICKSCCLKVEEAKNYKSTEIYKRLIDGMGFQPEFPTEFSEIGEKSEPEGYMGFIYADANRMGEHLAGKDSFDKLENFSRDVHEKNFEAIVSVLKSHFTGSFLPIQMILAGGDDLILTLPAHKAMDITIEFCESFNYKLSSHNNLTTSAAVVICHDSLPIRNILSAAESLLKNAKAESRKNGGGSYIDFTVVTGSALEEPISKRKQELEYLDIGSYSITKRPYSLEEMKKLVSAIKELKKVDFPNNKLKALYTYLFKGRYQSILDALYLKTRLEDAHKDTMDKLIKEFNLTKIFPWEEIDTNRYTTPFGDIVELYEFIH